MRSFTMVARHGSSTDNIEGYTLISSDYRVDYSDEKSLIAAIKKGTVICNLEIGENGRLKSSNGSSESYTFVNTASGMVEKSRAVILDRVEKDGKLIGYTVYTQNGTLQELSVADAVMLAQNKALANGKVRHTEQGDIVSAIGGTYPLKEFKSAKDTKEDDKVTMEVVMLVKASLRGVQSAINYAGCMVSAKSMVTLSKVMEQFTRDNAELIGKLVPYAGQDIREELKIHQVKPGTFYVVVPFNATSKVAKKEVVMSKSVIVSAVRYNEPGDYEEIHKQVPGGSDNFEKGIDPALKNAIKSMEQLVLRDQRDQQTKA